MIVDVIACVGLMFILKYGSILNWPRNKLCKFSLLNDLFKCSLCLGFWSGVIIGSFEYFNNSNTQMIMLPFVSAAVCWPADSIITILQYIELKLEKDNNS